MSIPAQGTSLSLSARLFCYLGPPSVILLTAIASPRTALLCPLALLPTAWGFKVWRESNKRISSRRGEVEVMVWTYAATSTIGITVVGLVQMAICSAVSNVIFRTKELRDSFWNEFGRATIDGLTTGQLERRAELAMSWHNWIFISAFTFLAAGFVEESLKYIPIAYARHRGTVEQRKQRNRAYIDYTVTSALSFGLVESIGFLYASCEQGHETWSKLIVTLFERIIVGSLGHLLAASLTALRATRRDYYGDRMSWWAVVGPSMILHGSYDFVAMASSALEGNVGWIHPTGLRITAAMYGLIGAVIVTASLLVRREWRSLGHRDRL
ncbi:hypothetical protein BDR22DRAFT_882348 [Usnea florida]